MTSDHHSIGEVLATLRDEFSDVTISKIRFLEAQGLIDPERTPSGYRKFRDGDVARLRWVLRQQKQNFLPLKVIKARLDAAGPDGLPEDFELDPSANAKELARGETTSGVAKKAPRKRAAPRVVKDSSGSKPARVARPPKPSAGVVPKPRASAKPVNAAPVFESPMLPLDDGYEEELVLEGSGASLTRAELATASGLSTTQLAELEEYGMVVPAAGSGERVIFDEDALVVAKLAAAFAAHGIGPRHLRMFRVAAEREAGLYDQVIAPRLRRRNPEARARAREDLMDLARLGRGLRAALLRSATAGSLSD